MNKRIIKREYKKYNMELPTDCEYHEYIYDLISAIDENGSPDYSKRCFCILKCEHGTPADPLKFEGYKFAYSCFAHPKRLKSYMHYHPNLEVELQFCG